MFATILVQFNAGNQIYGSSLQIMTDGSVIRNERSCCPPKITPVPEHPLSPRELSTLMGELSTAGKGPIVQENGYPTTDGSESGTLIAYVGGTSLVIHTITRNSSGQPDRVTFNRSPAAREIEALVDSYVKYPLYPGR